MDYATKTVTNGRVFVQQLFFSGQLSFPFSMEIENPKRKSFSRYANVTRLREAKNQSTEGWQKSRLQELKETKFYEPFIAAREVHALNKISSRSLHKIQSSFVPRISMPPNKNGNKKGLAWSTVDINRPITSPGAIREILGDPNYLKIERRFIDFIDLIIPTAVEKLTTCLCNFL